MADDEVIQEFIADMAPYIDAIEEAVHDARDFAQANYEAKAAVDEMRDSAATAGGALDDLFRHSDEVIMADRELRDASLEAGEAFGHERDEALEAAEALGHFRDESLEAAGAGRVAKDALGDSGGGGLVSSLMSLLKWLGPGGSTFGSGGFGVLTALSALGPILGVTVVGGAAAAVAALFPVIATLPVIAAGIGAFAAFAIPEISKVWKAVDSGGAALKKLDPAERALVEPIRDLKSEFSQLSKAIQPEILKAFADGLKIIKELMPAIRPLIKAAGDALDTFLGKIVTWLNSGSGQKFIHWLKVDGVGAIKAFGEFLWGLISVLGRTFSFLYNFGETVHRVFDRVRHDIAHWADDAHHDFDTVRHTVASWGHDIAHDFDEVRAKVHEFFTYIGAHLTPFTQFWRSHWHEIEQVAKAVWDVIVTNVKVALAIMITVIKVALMVILPFVKSALTDLEAAWHVAWAIMGTVLKTAWQVWTELVSGAIHLILNIISVVLDVITGHWSQAWHDMEKLVSDALHTIISIIKSLTSGFGSLLFNAGKSLITGLINGIQSMFGALGSVVSSIASKVAGFFGLSPAREGPLSGGGAPYIRGQHFGLDLIAGMRSVAPGLAAAAADLAGAAAAHLAVPALPGGRVPALAGAGAGGVAGGGTVTVNIPITVNGWVGSDQQLALKLQDTLLEHGLLNPTSGIWPLNKGRIR